MDWIKKNYDRFILAICAVALIGVAVMLFLNTQSFGDKFAAAMAPVNKNNTVPPVDTARIQQAKAAFDKPTQWSATQHSGLLFTSESYMVENGSLKRISEGSHTHPRTNEPIPYAWFMANGLPPLEPAVVGQDPDGDGFINADEWKYQTDPNKKDSHPVYYTQVFLAKWIKVPFRLKFQAYDGDPAKDKPEQMNFQINTLDLRQPSEFLKIGDTVSNTKFKIKSFTFKEAKNPSTGENDDVSELVVVNAESGEEVVLIKEKVVNSPTQFAEFEYCWNKKPGETGQPIRVQKLKEFALMPDVNQRYKLLDVNDTQAVIQLPDGKTYTVTQLKK